MFDPVGKVLRWDIGKIVPRERAPVLSGSFGFGSARYLLDKHSEKVNWMLFFFFSGFSWLTNELTLFARIVLIVAKPRRMQDITLESSS